MRIKDAVWKVKNLIVVQVLFYLIASVGIAFIPVCNKYLVDDFQRGAFKNVYSLIIGYIVCYGIYLLAGWISERFVWKTAIAFENVLKKACFEKLTQVSYRVYKRKKNEEYLSLLTNNITAIEQDYLQPVCSLIKTSAMILVYAVIISVYTSPIICLFLLGLSLIAVFSPKIYKNKLKKSGKEYVDATADYTKHISDLLAGIELVNSNTRKAFLNQNNAITDELSHKRYRLGKAKTNGNTISGSMICFIDIGIFILCVYLLKEGSITAGIAVAAITYGQSFADPMQELLYIFNMLNSSKDIVKNMEQLMEFEDDTVESVSGDADLNVCDKTVEFENKKLVFNGEFKRNEKYLLVGESGKGKSTLLNLISNRIDGIDFDLNPEQIFYLSQEQHIFSEDVFNNISIFGAYRDYKTYGIEGMPIFKNIKDKSDCSNLSGGEKQVVKFLRMLAQQKKILLIDEPFSALDNEVSKKLFHILTEIDATIIMVTHQSEFDEADKAKWDVVNIREICEG